MNHSSLEAVIEKQKKRYQVLRKLYELAGDDPTIHIPDSDLAKEVNLSVEELYRIKIYLKQENLIRGTIGALAVSHWGIKEIEDSIQYPHKPTDHFMAVVIQHFYGEVNGGVQVGGENNQQEVSVKSGEE